MNDLIKEAAQHVWLMEPNHLRRMLAQFAAIPQAALEQAIQKRIEAGTAKAFDNLQARGRGESGEEPPRAEVRDGVAHISIAGPLLKSVPSIFEMFGIQATSSVAVREMLAAAVEDAGVQSIVLDIDSPGGTVEGLAELADDVHAARDLKPVHTHAADLMASAAYWVGCQANSVSCGVTAEVGSIGVYMVMDDASAAYEADGIKTHVIASHPLKGAGVEGARITDAQLEDAKRVIDSYASLFVAAVARGRGLATADAEKLATGQVWLGQEAVDRKLADKVQSSDDAHKAATHPHRIRAQTPAAARPQEEPMTEAEKKELDELRTKLAASEQRVKELEANATSVTAQAREVLISKYGDRIAPAQLAAVKEYGAFCGADLAKLEAYLVAMPTVSRPSRLSDPGASTTPSGDGEAEDIAAAARKYQADKAASGVHVRISDAVRAVTKRR